MALSGASRTTVPSASCTRRCSAVAVIWSASMRSMRLPPKTNARHAAAASRCEDCPPATANPAGQPSRVRPGAAGRTRPIHAGEPARRGPAPRRYGRSPPSHADGRGSLPARPRSGRAALRSPAARRARSASRWRSPECRCSPESVPCPCLWIFPHLLHDGDRDDFQKFFLQSRPAVLQAIAHQGVGETDGDVEEIGDVLEGRAAEAIDSLARHLTVRRPMG